MKEENKIEDFSNEEIEKTLASILSALKEEEREAIFKFAKEKPSKNDTKRDIIKYLFTAFTIIRIAKEKEIEDLKNQLKETQNPTQENKEEKVKRIALNMVRNMARFKYKDEIYQAHEVDFEEFSLICIKVERNEEENHIFKNYHKFVSKDMEQFIKMIETFKEEII